MWACCCGLSASQLNFDVIVSKSDFDHQAHIDVNLKQCTSRGGWGRHAPPSKNGSRHPSIEENGSGGNAKTYPPVISTVKSQMFLYVYPVEPTDCGDTFQRVL